MKPNKKNPHKGISSPSGIDKAVSEKTIDKKSLTNLTNLGQLENEERRQIEINRLLTEDRNDEENLPILIQQYQNELDRLDAALKSIPQSSSHDEYGDEVEAVQTPEFTTTHSKILEISSQKKEINNAFLRRQEARQTEIRKLRILSQKFMLDYPEKPSFLELQILKLGEEYPEAKSSINAAFIMAKEKWKKHPYLRNQIFVIEVINHLFPNPKTNGITPTTNIQKASKAIELYMDEGYNTLLANYLNSRDTGLTNAISNETTELVSSLDVIFSYVDPLLRDITVYRGIKPVEGISSSLEDILLSHKSFLSTSLFRQEAARYAFETRNEFVIPIIIKQGSKILPIGSLLLDVTKTNDAFDIFVAYGEILLSQDIYRQFYKNRITDQYTYETAKYLPYVEFVEDVKKHLDFRYPKSQWSIASLFSWGGWGLLGFGSKQGGRINKLKTHKNKKYKTKKNKARRRFTQQ